MEWEKGGGGRRCNGSVGGILALHTEGLSVFCSLTYKGNAPVDYSDKG